MNYIGEAAMVLVILFMVFVFQGDPDIWTLAQQKVISELKK